MLRCPACHEPLARAEASWRCPAGHSFDVARDGYVNLLAPGGAGRGDTRAMLQSRRAFLDAGFYDRLADELVAFAPPGGAVLDAGCGEGFYLRRLRDAPATAACTRIGIDVARDAVKYAARRDGGGVYAVASVFDLPLVSASIDVVLSVFSHRSDAEFARVLRPRGRLVAVLPGPDHLLGLRELLYGTAVGHPPRRVEESFPGFELRERTRLRYEIAVERAQAGALFAMTPYAWHADATARDRLARVEQLTTPVDFELALLERG
jgi:23S rRNA (guanine745-N1)-methyltransferase